MRLAGENSDDLKDETSDAGDRGKKTDERETGRDVAESSVKLALVTDGSVSLMADGLGLLSRTRRGPGGGLKTSDEPRPIEAPVLVPTGWP